MVDFERKAEVLELLNPQRY